MFLYISATYYTVKTLYYRSIQKRFTLALIELGDLIRIGLSGPESMDWPGTGHPQLVRIWHLFPGISIPTDRV